MIFDTELRYRQLLATDINLIKRLYQDATVMKHIGNVKNDQEVHQLIITMLKEVSRGFAKYFVLKGYLSGSGWCDANKKLNDLGIFSLHWNASTQIVKLGIMVLPEFQGKGIFKKAHHALMADARTEFPVKKFTAITAVKNVTANNCYENLGFKASLTSKAGRDNCFRYWELK
ncbi:GNAT family N-acetyltransferase [Marinicella sp. S1101]|uniref:GNAT family N-acetyltransferase n=1 Tax=Marinicella marina TaxID=2996016 RepID=UPI002260CEB9|nr:GNAT family N-acetyltransferase [Marinicella marina]MCX7553812.1 GNAT family N-acetyltransferase [Marinicella marina]MDJ1140888.1 GNAT family N-acetyltransferase [Marinicella marina]